MPQLLTYRDTERLLARLRGMNLVLVGGQAVHFWAERFHQHELDPRLPRKFLEYRYPQLYRQLAERRNESELRGG
jgi:hypothetical protein